MRLTDPITILKGIGPALAARFAILKIESVQDLVDNYPRRYDDYSQMTAIKDLEPGAVSIRARIKSAKGMYAKRGLHITEAVAEDDSSSVRVVWFNQPYRAAALQPGQEYFIAGNFELSNRRLSILNPTIEKVSDMPLNTARIVPVYRETKGLTSRQMRSALEQVLPLIKYMPEILPAWINKELKLIPRSQAVMAMHLPEAQEDLTAARRKLGFEEVFALSLAALINKRQLAVEIAPAVPFKAPVAKKFVEYLPFSLTSGQRSTVWQIYQDINRTQPMNRLVEGDVGSGKTVVAAMAAAMVLHDGHATALMAPTELLARQHAATIYKLLEPLGFARGVGLLVGSLKSAEKERARQAVKEGKINFLIGTQALIQDSVDMSRLELVIIDEQHRFGVNQRQKLQIKAGHMPHVLSLTATPIPRSLALTLYGELDVSIIKDKPPGRSPTMTELVSPNSRAQLYQKLDEQITQGRQLFVVCPLITESGAESMSHLQSAEQVYEQLSKQDFKHRRIGLLHGKLKPADKQAVMQEFLDHKLDILVSTTVIEVGVDVPNASVMLIEGAERFGLAQIHQLRGRVGRGRRQGYCYLMLSDSKAPSKRLRALESSNDGFKLAELDLEIRGPGAIYGTMQHGALDLRVATLTDIELITMARQAAGEFLDKGEDLLQYPYLESQVRRLSAVTNLN